MGSVPIFKATSAEHVDVEDAVFVVGIADGDEAEALIEFFQALLGADADAVAGVLVFGAADAFGDQFAADAGSARGGRGQNAAQRHFVVLGAGRQAAQVGGQGAFAAGRAP